MRIWIFVFSFLTFFIVGATSQAHVTAQQLSASVTGTSTVGISANILRKYLLIQNRGTDTVYVKAASAHSGTEGVAIVAGGYYEPSSVPVDSLFMKSASGTQTVIIIEGN